jgi:P-type E1-E2 ATPase
MPRDGRPMTLHIIIPGAHDLSIEHLVLDVNGTLSDRGEPIVAALRAVGCLRDELQLHVLSADTFGTAKAIAASIQATFRRVDSGRDKLEYIESLGAQQCVAIGNGRNDGPMLQAAGLGIAVLGPEGLHAEALTAADVVALSIDEALGLLADARALTATLRP